MGGGRGVLDVRRRDGEGSHHVKIDLNDKDNIIIIMDDGGN